FTHGLSDEALSALLASAEMAVVPSLYEGFSLPAVEHMASGTPLVASRSGARWRTGPCAGSASGSPGPRWPMPPSGSTWPRWKGWPPRRDRHERTGRVLTVDFRRFPVRPGHRVLDLGCGGGRHAFEVYRRGADV